MHHPLCIYHKDCLDGFAAAWVVWKAFHGHIDAFAAEYQDCPPDIPERRDIERRDVVIVDFSYPRPVLRSMADSARCILAIDHHSTAQGALSDPPKNVTVKLDMEYSACMLAFRHFFPDDEPPVLLRHIEDRDLWRFALQGTREAVAALQSYQQDFMLWDDLMAAPIDPLYVEGTAILRRYEVDLQEAIAQTRRIMHIAGYSVPAANVPKFKIGRAHV